MIDPLKVRVSPDDDLDTLKDKIRKITTPVKIKEELESEVYHSLTEPRIVSRLMAEILISRYKEMIMRNSDISITNKT